MLVSIHVIDIEFNHRRVRGLAAAISVISDELTATIHALVLLFSVSGCAILFDVQ